MLSLTITLLITCTQIVGVLLLYLRHRHQALRSQVTSVQISPARRRLSVSRKEIESLPEDLLDHPEKYRIIHEQDSIRLPRSLDYDWSQREDAEVLFTQLMRRNMLYFSTWLPQSYFMRLLAKTKEQKASFSLAHIKALDFKQGDLVCGFYRVLVRRPMRCEMGMAAPAAGLPESFGGRLIISVVPVGEGEGEGGKGVEELVLRTETLQWVGREEKTVLPLERGTMRWLHEFASWGLLISGAKSLEEQAKKIKSS